MPDISRRTFLTTVGAGVVGALGASTATAEHLDQRPASVTIDYPESVLEQYKPNLVTYHLDFEPSGIHGWRATSPDYEMDALVFWTEYPRQEGVSPFSGRLSDSHFGDHEPAYVFVDSQTGEVQEVVMSVYHWLRGLVYPESLTFDDQRPRLKPVNPWHQYTPTQEVPQSDIGLQDLRDSLPVWLEDAKFHESLAPGLCVNPWRMQGTGGREHWWRDTVGGVSTDALLVSTLADISATTGLDIAGFGDSATQFL